MIVSQSDVNVRNLDSFITVTPKCASFAVTKVYSRQIEIIEKLYPSPELAEIAARHLAVEERRTYIPLYQRFISVYPTGNMFTCCINFFDALAVKTQAIDTALDSFDKACEAARSLSQRYSMPMIPHFFIEKGHLDFSKLSLN